MRSMNTLKSEIAASAAALVVEEGLDYGSAKRRAVKQMGLTARTELPGNDEIESAVREYISVFCADSQPVELAALRELALIWMGRLVPFRPYLSGAVWHGTATRLSDIYIQLFCDDPKSAEIALIDRNVTYEPRTVKGFTGEPVEALSIQSFCKSLDETVGVHLMVYDHNDLRGALRIDASGRSPRGDIAAVEKLIANISDAAKLQSASAGHIATTMNVVQEITSQTTTATFDTARSVSELANMAEALRESVTDFKLPD